MAKFLRENPRLDKKTIGDYIGDKKNSRVLEAFVRYLVFLIYTFFTLRDKRIDKQNKRLLNSVIKKTSSLITFYIKHSAEIGLFKEPIRTQSD